MNIKHSYDNNIQNSLYILINYIDTNELLTELQNKKKIKWHTHKYIEIDETHFFIKKMCENFNVSLLKCRINYFDKNTTKEFHKDFYNQDLTIVLNIYPGLIVFKHDKTNVLINFHLESNTLYIFDKYINEFWSHKVESVNNERYSIVLWCKIR